MKQTGTHHPMQSVRKNKHFCALIIRTNNFKKINNRQHHMYLHCLSSHNSDWKSMWSKLFKWWVPKLLCQDQLWRIGFQCKYYKCDQDPEVFFFKELKLEMKIQWKQGLQRRVSAKMETWMAKTMIIALENVHGIFFVDFLEGQRTVTSAFLGSCFEKTNQSSPQHPSLPQQILNTLLRPEKLCKFF